MRVASSVTHRRTYPLSDTLVPARRLLGVWAHPDDETYLSGALMHRVIEAGGAVTVVSATRGELGGGPDVAGAALGRRREAELRAAMAALGVDDVRVLDQPDGGCADVDVTVAAASIRRLIDEVRPDLVVTFGPDGITGHADHQAVSSWVTSAVSSCRADGVPDAPRLLHATMTHEFVVRHRRDYAVVPLTVAGDPRSVAESELALRVVPTVSERKAKRAALSAHASQIGALVDLVGMEPLLDWWVEECFCAADVARRDDLGASERGSERHETVSTCSPDPLQASRRPAVHSDSQRHTPDRQAPPDQPSPTRQTRTAP